MRHEENIIYSPQRPFGYVNDRAFQFSIIFEALIAVQIQGHYNLFKGNLIVIPSLSYLNGNC